MIEARLLPRLMNESVSWDGLEGLRSCEKYAKAMECQNIMSEVCNKETFQLETAKYFLYYQGANMLFWSLTLCLNYYSNVNHCGTQFHTS